MLWIRTCRNFVVSKVKSQIKFSIWKWSKRWKRWYGTSQMSQCEELIIWKKKKKFYHNEQTRTNQQGRNKLRDELILERIMSGDKGCVYHCASRMLYSGYRYFLIKKKYSYDKWLHSVHFTTLLLITYFNTGQTPICQGEIKFDRVYFLEFCTNYNTVYKVYKILSFYYANIHAISPMIFVMYHGYF